MKSRAELLAELEENRQKNINLSLEVDELSILGSSVTEGYDPYDNPGTKLELPDGADLTALRGKRRR